MRNRAQPVAGRTASGGFSLFVVLWCVFLAAAAPAQMVGSRHDFVQYGFSGGGACAACHVPHNAATIRLYPRPVGATVLLLCKDCHKDASPALPTGPGWTTVTGAPTPPRYPHPAETRFDDCTRCHAHIGPDPFGPPPNDDCLTCHKAGGVSSIDIDGLFAQIGENLEPNPPILSQHNAYYITDGNTGTYEPFWPAAAGGNANECKKCHGDKAEDGVALRHPSSTVRLVETGPRTGMLRSAFLVYSDASGNAMTPTATYAYPRQPDDKRLYELFCANCHKGKPEGSTPVSEKLGGPLGGSQVGPTLRTNPANQQPPPSPPASGWIVAAVPPKDAQLPAPYLNDRATGRPEYFAYFGTNGHGNLAAPISGGTMDRTCLSGGTNGFDGCHVPHGSRSRFLLDDALMFPPAGIKTASGVGTAVCMAADCHVPGVNFALDQSAGQISTFHGWWANGTVLHDNSPLNGGVPPFPALDGMSQWRVYGKANMNISGAAAPVGILPFYGDPAGATELHQRAYPTALSGTASWVSCLTCHDPHGTGPDTEPGMGRRFDDTMSYTSPLCGECHVE
ncbi:MAG: cytochrome c3 family protein [Thermodesulfobacteriota bacterium]